MLPRRAGGKGGGGAVPARPERSAPGSGRSTAYHLGYGDFRSRKVVQPNVGATIGSVPTLVSASPVASPLSHVALHVAAVLHVPDSDLYLPPHRDQVTHDR